MDLCVCHSKLPQLLLGAIAIGFFLIAGCSIKGLVS